MLRKILSKEFLKVASVPLVLIGVIGAFLLLYRLLDLPNNEEIIRFVHSYYDQYGYSVVFVGALIEGALLINWYLPGSIVIIFGVVFAKGDPIKAAIMILLVVMGFTITSFFNYALGKYGWYRLLLKFGLQKPLQSFRAKVEAKGLSIIFSTYIHPNLGALTATSAGILQLPFKKFAQYSILALVAWNTLWGVVAYFSGPIILNHVSTTTVLAVLLIWLAIVGYKFLKQKTGSEHISIP